MVERASRGAEKTIRIHETYRGKITTDNHRADVGP